MYAGRIACCRLVSHGEYADGTNMQTDRQTDGRTDGRQIVTLRSPLDAASVIIKISNGLLLRAHLRPYQRVIHLYKR